jgi:hypothetical protein
VLYNGNAGWSKTSGGIGICHGELKRALDTAPGKVRLIRLGSDADVKAVKGTNHEQFQGFVERHDLFRGAANTIEELMDIGERTVLHAIADLVGFGVREARKGRYYFGDALEWSKLGYRERQIRIQGVLNRAMIAAGGERISESFITHSITGDRVLFVVNGVPAAFTISAARELVGRPFLRDHELAGIMKKLLVQCTLLGAIEQSPRIKPCSYLGSRTRR